MKEPRLLLIKSHVAAYTKKDGTFVAEHDDKRAKAAAAPKTEQKSVQSQIAEQVNAAWDKAVGDSGKFVIGKMYPASVTANGKTLKFGVFKDSGSGPKKLATIVPTKFGPQLNYYKMSPSGDLSPLGQKNLWALTPEARDAHVAEFEAMFR